MSEGLTLKFKVKELYLSKCERCQIPLKFNGNCYLHLCDPFNRYMCYQCLLEMGRCKKCKRTRKNMIKKNTYIS